MQEHQADPYPFRAGDQDVRPDARGQLRRGHIQGGAVQEVPELLRQPEHRPHLPAQEAGGAGSTGPGLPGAPQPPAGHLRLSRVCCARHDTNKV